MKRIKQLRAQQGNDKLQLRVEVDSGGCSGFQCVSMSMSQSLSPCLCLSVALCCRPVRAPESESGLYVPPPSSPRHTHPFSSCSLPPHRYVFTMEHHDPAAAPDEEEDEEEEDEEEEDEKDLVFERDGAQVLVDANSLAYIRGSTIDYEQELIRSGMCLSVYLSIYLSVCLSIYLSIYIFAPH